MSGSLLGALCTLSNFTPHSNLVNTEIMCVSGIRERQVRVSTQDVAKLEPQQAGSLLWAPVLPALHMLPPFSQQSLQFPLLHF